MNNTKDKNGMGNSNHIVLRQSLQSRDSTLDW